MSASDHTDRPLPPALEARLSGLTMMAPRRAGSVRTLAWELADHRYLMALTRAGILPRPTWPDPVREAYRRRSHDIFHTHVPEPTHTGAFSSNDPWWVRRRNAVEAVVWRNRVLRIVVQVPGVLAAWAFSQRYVTRIPATDRRRRP